MFGVRNIKFCESNSNLGRVLIDQHLMFPLVEPCGKEGALNEPVQLKMAQVNGMNRQEMHICVNTHIWLCCGSLMVVRKGW